MLKPPIALPLLTKLQGRAQSQSRLIEVSVLVAYLAWLALVIFRYAAIRPLWYDELFTLHLARVASPVDLFHHLASGVDLNPPLLYLLTRASVLAFGETTWALRLPALAGMLLGTSCFYLFLRRSRGTLVALTAVAASVASTKVWIFFLEARPYGLVFGFAGLLLLSWQRRWYFLLAAACILGVSSHYYFVMPIAVLSLTELARQLLQRNFNWKPIAAFATGGIALLAWYPLWSVAPRDYAAGFWAKVTFTRNVVQEAFWQFAEPFVVIPLLIAVSIAVLLGDRDGLQPETRRAPRSETLAIVLLAVMPFFAVYLSAKVTGGMHYRYVLPAAFGFGGLFAIAIERIARGHPAACTLSFLAFILLGQPYNSKPFREAFGIEANMISEQTTFLGVEAEGKRVVIETGYDFGRHWQASSGRYFPLFLADPDIALKRTNVDTTERALQKLKQVTNVPVLTVDELVAELQSGKATFYYGPADAWGYHELVARGVRFAKISEQGCNKLFRLTLPRTDR